MKNKSDGTAIIELNHRGIPDDELQPEEFNARQLQVLKALPPERQAQIRRGCPVKVVDLDTGEEVAAFNMMNVALSEFDMEMLARSLYKAAERYFSNPENMARYEEWERQHKPDGGSES